MDVEPFTVENQKLTASGKLNRVFLDKFYDQTLRVAAERTKGDDLTAKIGEYLPQIRAITESFPIDSISAMFASHVFRTKFGINVSPTEILQFSGEHFNRLEDEILSKLNQTMSEGKAATKKLNDKELVLKDLEEFLLEMNTFEESQEVINSNLTENSCVLLTGNFSPLPFLPPSCC